MQRETYDLMFDQVRAAYRALTGGELPAGEMRVRAVPLVAEAIEEVMESFAQLEAWIRGVPSLAERVAPFSFTPPLDVYERDKELVVEVAAPGVADEDVRVERVGDTLSISGVRRNALLDERTYRRAELARGPFRRVINLPSELANSQPRVEVERGLVRVRLGKPSMATVAQA